MDSSFGFRSRRSAHDAIPRVRDLYREYHIGTLRLTPVGEKAAEHPQAIVENFATACRGCQSSERIQRQYSDTIPPNGNSEYCIRLRK